MIFPLVMLLSASAMGEWSKIIQTIPKVLVCLCYSQTEMEIQFMCCGAVGHPEGTGRTGGCCHRLPTSSSPMAERIYEEAHMKKQPRTKLIHEGQYLAEVDVELLVTDDEWSPYLSMEDAYKLDDVRNALRKGDTATATRYGRVFILTPLAV